MRTLAGVIALLLTALLAASAASQPRPPQIDDLPPLPAPKGGKKAVFDVIVEGFGGASRQVDGEGANGVCQVTSHTESHQTYEYGRGRGLRVVFRKPGPTALLTRAGRRAPRAVFNVRGSTRTSAEGEATRTGDAVLCQPVTEKVGDESECNRTIRRAVNMALGYTQGELKLELAAEPLPPLPGTGCGSNGVETVSGTPTLGWEGWPELEPGGLPMGRIFGKRRRFRVKMDGLDRFQGDSPNPAFVGRFIERGSHDAVVRFIRVVP